MLDPFRPSLSSPFCKFTKQTINSAAISPQRSALIWSNVSSSIKAVLSCYINYVVQMLSQVTSLALIVSQTFDM